MQLSLSVKDKSIETSGITKDYKEALCEFIWNSFEANATEVEISYTKMNCQVLIQFPFLIMEMVLFMKILQIHLEHF